MKKIMILSFMILLFLQNCKKDEPIPALQVNPPPVPTASFTVTSTDDGVATFTNTSKDADTFDWDFGDNKGKSTEKNPTYQFSKTDKYVVTLKAIGKGGSNSVQSTTEIKLVQKDIASIDAKIEAFIAKYNIPGASFAVSKNGKMVYAKGYGFADKEKSEKVTPEHIFRLASISKTYTGVAIMNLIQEGKLNIDDKVFGDGGILGNDYGSLPLKADLSKITVNHLLHHTAGAWGSGTGGDVIDQNPTYDYKQFYDWIINTRPLAKAPNTVYDYTNIGYNLLGRIIEKVSKKSYLNYIKENIVAKTGGNVALAKKTLEERMPKEVKYYAQGSDAIYPYIIAFPRRDSDGGLVASAPDLLRFCNAIDGFSTRPDILDSKTFAVFKTPSSIFADYGCGVGIWDAQKALFAYGSLPGTRTGAMWGQNGMSVVLIMNARVDFNTANSNTFIYEQQDIMLDMIKNSSYKWQDIDQF
jgi:D-alanyl-D-alanine carboxypeptidase